jgi:hypothetical protein
LPAPSPDIWCRAAAPADIPAIAGLPRDAYPQSQADLSLQLPSLSVAVLDEQVSGQPVPGQQVAGHGKLHHFTDLPGVSDSYYLAGVVVGPRWRRRGIRSFWTEYPRPTEIKWSFCDG